MRLRDNFASPISAEEIERVKRLRDSGAAPPPRQKTEHEALRSEVLRAGNPQDDMTRERMNGREQAGLYSLAGANELLEHNVPDGLQRRMQKLGLWWRFSGLTKQLRGIQTAIQESAETDQLLTIFKRCQHVSTYVGMDRVGDPDGTWVRIPDLNTVCEAVLSDTCGLCVKTGAEADHCQLRKALRAMTTISSREVAPARNGCIYKSMTIMEEIEVDEE